MLSKQKVDPRLIEVDDALYRVAAKAVITKDDRILLIYEKDDDWWGFPGGGIDYGETIHEALVREIREELGIMAEHVIVDDTVAFISIGSIVNGVPRANLFYHVTIPEHEIKPTDDVPEQQWYSLEELAHLRLSPSASNTMTELQKILSAER